MPVQKKNKAMSNNPDHKRMSGFLLSCLLLLFGVLLYDSITGLSRKNTPQIALERTGEEYPGVVWADSAAQANSDAPTRLPRPYEKAIDLYYAGNLAESIKALRQFISDHPEDNQARLDLVVLLREAGRLQEAYTHLDLLSRKFPQKPEYQGERAKTAYLLGQGDLIRKLEAYGKPSEGFSYWRDMGSLNLEEVKRLSGIDSLKSSLKSSPAVGARSALTHFTLGQVYLEEKNFSEAESHLRQALRRDAYFNAALYPLAQAYLGQGKIKPAYDILRKADQLTPWDQKIDEELARLVSNHPDLARNEQKEKEEKVLVTSPIRVTPFQSNGAAVPLIRVGLAESIADLRIKTGDAFVLTEEGGPAKITGSAETVLSIYGQNGKIRVSKEDGTVLITTSSMVTLSYEEATVQKADTSSTQEKTAPTTAIFDLQFGRGQYWAGEADRFYRGEIQFMPNKKGITVINRLSLEEYLYSVLPAEMPAGWPKEALRAQAIAARSYALANMGGFANRGFDVMGSVLSAAYQGAKKETKNTNWAVDSTRGQVITYNGKVIPAFFSANSGGYTESQKSVWGSNNPYLQAVPDKLLSQKDGFFSPYQLYQWVETRPRTYSANSTSSYRWQVLVPAADIKLRLGQGDKVGRITAITTAGRGISGRVEKVIVKGDKGEFELTGDLNIRNKLGGLRSTLFTVEPKYGKDGLPEFFLFTGAGWGHGVGMCQTGASGMASAGYKGEEILTHYYSGVEITTLY